MKQFTYTDARGHSFGPYTLDDVRKMSREIVNLEALNALAEGGNWVDAQGDLWIRCTPDDERLASVVADERLERITLEYLRFLGPAYLTGALELDADKSLASCCVTNARELIAELDKPA